jgi:hypothetical protein
MGSDISNELPVKAVIIVKKYFSGSPAVIVR